MKSNHTGSATSDEPTLLIAVLEIDCCADQSTAIQRLKLRVTGHSYEQQGDLSIDDLQQELTKAISAQDNLQEISNFRIHDLEKSNNGQIYEIYDPHVNDYISLENCRRHREYSRIVQRFGRRLRVRVLVESKEEENPPEPLAIAGRFFDFDGELNVVGRTIRIREDVNVESAGTSATVWDGAILLARYLENDCSAVHRNWHERPKIIMELGAGCGLSGIAAAVITGAQALILTDLPVALPRLERNVETNQTILSSAGCRRTFCRPCDWYNPPELSTLLNGTTDDALLQNAAPDIILIADCVWTEELVTPLFATLGQYVKTDQTQVLVSYQRRGKSTDDAFWNALRGLFATVMDVTYRLKSPKPPDVFHVLSCKR